MKSYWQMLGGPVSCPQLDRNIQCGVAVVGAGLAGLTAACELLRQGADVTLVEARSVGSGASGANTGKGTVQHDDIYGRLTRSKNRGAALAYHRAMQAGLDHLRAQHDALGLPYRAQSNIMFATGDKGKLRLKEDYLAASAIGLHAALHHSIDLPVDDVLAVEVKNQLAIDPAAYCRALAADFVRRGGHIYTHTRVVDIDEGHICQLRTDTGHRIVATAVIQTVGFPIHPKMGAQLVRLRPERAHLMAFKLRGSFPEGMYLSLDRAMPTLRTHDGPFGRVLIAGGMDHRVGAMGSGVYRHIESYVRRRFDVGEALAAWGAQDYMTADGMPYVGRAHGHERVFTAVGFNKWGLTGATAAGLALADMVLGRLREADHPFSMRRTADLLSYGALSSSVESGTHFLADRFTFAAQLPDRAGEGKILRIGGELCGAYRRADGELLLVSAICPHLGCALSFNAAEHSFDCPCHGSRFAPDGRVIHGPSVEPLRPVHF